MNHVVLTGFMGAGKTTVGQLLGAALGYPFVDLDAEIERREGMRVAALFAERGEPGFRDAEHAALEALADSAPSVIATGGGVVLREDNQVLLKRLGPVVYLAVTPEEAMARLGDAGDRPLLADGGLAAAHAILGARLALYAATADHVVDTGGRTAEEVADAVRVALDERATPDLVRVTEPGGGGYDILIGAGLLADVGARVAETVAATSAALVTDETVWSLFGPGVKASLEGAGIRVSEHVVPAGEESKSWERAGDLLEQFAAAGLDRASVVVALGGGVVGDLAGLCAATYMRGIALVHVPTTLLAQVDSAIGGKTAIDLRAGKNLAGAFWPPRLVLSDTRTLAGLPDAEWTNGLVEAAKTALLAGGAILERFEGGLDDLMARDSRAVAVMVRDAASFKAAVVSADVREADRRECLNLGHTLGHALETLVGYGAIPHGIAVAEGMRFAARLAESEVGAGPGLTERTVALLERIGAGAAVAAHRLRPVASALTPDAVLAAMKADKKSRAGEVRFVMLERPGVWRAAAVDDAALLDALAWWAGELGEA
ncbi:MAG: 3-dehydroquinate synthase [Coriobacteriia bacterium]|nr:3-dehydroquinate synthase [Coriobacteriia bacterium]